MRKLLVLPLLTLAFACTDRSPVEPVLDEPDLAVAEKKMVRKVYHFTAERDWACKDEASGGCILPTAEPQPDGKVIVSGGRLRWNITGGDWEGMIWFEPRVTYDPSTMSGFGVGTATFQLVHPADGEFRCSSYFQFAGTPYEEQGWYYLCKGSGDFKHATMFATYTNMANPGFAAGDFVATVLYFRGKPIWKK